MPKQQSWLCGNCLGANMEWDTRCRVCGYNRSTIGSKRVYQQPQHGRKIA
jgi:hypothetical protein